MAERKCTTVGYKPRWRFRGSKEWKDIPVTWALPGTGIDYPRYDWAVLAAAGLYGYEQANAIAWKYAAGAATMGEEIEVEVQEWDATSIISTWRVHV